MKKALGVLAALTLCVGVAHAGIVNGNFENGLNGWTITLTDNGTAGTPTTVNYDIDGGGPLGTSMAGQFEAGNAVFTGVQEGFTIWQNIFVATGTQFAANISADNRGANGNAEGGVFTLLVGNTVLDTHLFGSIDPFTKEYDTLSGTYNGAPGNYNVGIKVTRPYTLPGTLFQLIDNVTPEPTSLLLLGVGALFAARRR